MIIMVREWLIKVTTALTFGGDPPDSSIATPKIDMTAPNQVRAGIIAPNIPSSRGTTIT